MVWSQTDYNNYRFGFNGMEGDTEMNGENNSYDFGARMYDPRVGRWLSIDPLAANFPDKTPYAFVSNNPIMNVDIDGRIDYKYTVNYRDNGDGTSTKVINAVAIYNVVNMSTASHVGIESVNVGSAQKDFDIGWDPRISGLDGIDVVDDCGNPVSYIEFNFTVEERLVKPENFSKISDKENIAFVADDVKKGDGNALAWGSIGGQSILLKRSSGAKGPVVSHEIGHNFDLKFGKDSHSPDKSSFMYETVGGTGQPDGAILQELLDNGLGTNHQSGMTYYSGD